MSTSDAEKNGLRLTVVGANVTALRTCATCVAGRYGDDHSTCPCQLVFELPAKLVPPLVENGSVESGFLPDVPTGVL
ncbi:MAG: hypothetical protein R6V18_06045, partial [Desulfuromonadaceae bacterium]